MGCQKLNTDFFNFLEIVHSEKRVSEEKKRINYYPFGLKHKGYNGNINGVDHKFEYNGVEMEEALGLNLMEMDFRQYDPTIARFTSIDPVTHFSNSTYNGFDNNPIIFADPSGADAYETNESYVFTGVDAENAFKQLQSRSGNTNEADSNGGNCDNPPCDGESEEVVVAPIRGLKAWVAGVGDVFGRFRDWLKGDETKFREEHENNFANSFINAWRINEARKYFYAQLNRGRDLGSDPITNYSGAFGFEGAMNAGLDPYEQFVGSYSIIEIKLVTTGEVMTIQYTLINDTHAKSLTYGIGTSWDRKTFAPMSTVRQEIIFTENVIYRQLNNRAKEVINRYRVKNYVKPLR